MDIIRTLILYQEIMGSIEAIVIVTDKEHLLLREKATEIPDLIL